MRLLTAVPGSVLWLLDANELVKDNLRGEAIKRGVDSGRLVFARRQSSPEHLARHRLADLFLDTLPYNAHTTASDALWAGPPVLGTPSPGVLRAACCRRLACPSLSPFRPPLTKASVCALRGEPALLQSLQHKLLGNRLNAPLFDIARYTRHFEAALTQMSETWANGHEPMSFAVPPSLPMARRCSPHRR